MLKNILIGLVLIVGGFLAFAATRPDTYHVERSKNRRARKRGVRRTGRPARMGCLVALGQTRSANAKDV